MPTSCPSFPLITNDTSMRVVARLHANIRPQLRDAWLLLHVTRCPTQRLLCCCTNGWRPWSIRRWPTSIHPHSQGSAPQARCVSTREPTIYALSSGSGRAAIAVIRISGGACLEIYHALCPGKAVPKARVAAVRTLYEPGKDLTPSSVLDSSALILYFPAPRSATGEDVLELHVHGGPAVVKAVLAAIAGATRVKDGGGVGHEVRYAEPGEFTRRAFYNQRLDLTQVEALGDILSAETEQQRRLSVRGSSAQLGRLYEDWRKRLLDARGELEALIDFSEDQHFDESPTELCASVVQQVRALQRILRTHTQNAVRGELLRKGISLALLGAPNAGKSSLLNRIVGREAAIVSREAGTTRDVVEVGLDVGGYLCRIGDTAGLRSASTGDNVHQQYGLSSEPVTISQIEEEGMRRSKALAQDSDVVVVVLSFEHSQGHVAGGGHQNCRGVALRISPDVRDLAARLVRDKGNVRVVINKADLALQPHVRESALQETLSAFPGLGKDAVHMVSCVAAAGQDAAGSADVPLEHMRRSTACMQRQAADRDPGCQADAERSADATAGIYDAGGVQAFLRGLVQQFAGLTAPLTNEQPGASSEAAAAAAAAAHEEQEEEEVETSVQTQREAADVRSRARTSTVATAAAAAAAAPDSAPAAPDPALASAPVHWDESLGASVRHRNLLEACISHLDGCITATSSDSIAPAALGGLEVPRSVPTSSQSSAATSSITVGGAAVAAAADITDRAAEALPAVCQPYAGLQASVHVQQTAGLDLREQAISHHAVAEPDMVAAAEHLRAAAECLARITGRGDGGDVEEVLGVVFEKFCVGK